MIIFNLSNVERVEVARQNTQSYKNHGVSIDLSLSLFFYCSGFCHILKPYRLQHARLPCSSPSPGACSRMSIESGMRSNHLILCHPFLLLLSIFPSIRVFSNELALRIRWPNYWSLSFSISPWTIKKQRHYFANKVHLVKALKSLLQYHSSKASILRHSAFFMVSSSHICTWLLGEP